MKHQQNTAAQTPDRRANKWDILRELATARRVYSLSDRDMTVLQALISFHPDTELQPDAANLVVHPSNRSISERLNGMPESTLRRHLSQLVKTGMILRRDSPNGKRYARRHGEGKIAYGFDLAPLVSRFSDIRAAANHIRATDKECARLREAVSLMRRDLMGLAAYGRTLAPDADHWDAFTDMAALTARTLRRKLDVDDLRALEAELLAALTEVRDRLEPFETEEPSANADQNERHYQSQNKDIYESEPGTENDTGNTVTQMSNVAPSDLHGKTATKPRGKSAPPNVSLGLVLAACPEIQTYASHGIRHWHELVQTVDTVAPMMGVSPIVWEDAKHAMGPEEASVVIAAMLERFSDIRSPGGYLRHLSEKARKGEFSCGPMVMAQMRRKAA